ncbi:hypothetical protein TWF694_006107 [Orbilia ellipsospora]|uniref:alpha-L-rhamnosidase n=1 Tax=Orbilia ellipsospora TaxID=2528407 RepID=A0AAV9WR93_9PEZI
MMHAPAASLRGIHPTTTTTIATGVRTPDINITNLRFSQTSNLLGVDIPRPSISWSYSIPHSLYNWWQQSYFITLKCLRGVAAHKDPENRPTALGIYTYTTRDAKTSRTENIPWPEEFPDLQSLCDYEITVVCVLIRGGPQMDVASLAEKGVQVLPSGSATAIEQAQDLPKGLEPDLLDQCTVSAHLHFETAFLGGIDEWRKFAPAIAPISSPWNLDNWNKPQPVLVFQNTYCFSEQPACARIFATAFGSYKIYINGRPISDSTMDPGWTEYKLRLFYQTYDVTKLLHAGQNTMTVFLADGWYRGRLVSGWQARRGIFGQETGFMALLQTSSELLSEGSEFYWTGETNETGWKCTRTSPILETEIYDGEHHDSRIKIDMLRDNKVHDNTWEDVKVMKTIWSNDQSPALQSTITPPIRCTGILEVQRIITSPDGKRVLDFGQNCAGRVRIKGSAPAGTKVGFVHVELLEPSGKPCTGLLREAKATDTYIFNGSGVEEWEPEFTFHGFRYVQVDPWIEGLEVVVKVYGSDLPRGITTFKSSHRELNRLVENAQWSARANFFSVCTDCPQRDERLGWTGDINAFGPTALYIFDCQTFLTSWLRGLVDGQTLGGRGCPPLVSPNALKPPGSHRPNALWQDVLVTLPWYMYQVYGDNALLTELYESMVEYQTRGIPKDPSTGLWAASFQYGDWLDPTAPPDHPDRPATSPMYVADTWLCNITNTLVKITKVLQKTDKIEYWTSKATKLVSQWRSKYLLAPKPGTGSDIYESSPQVLSQDTQTALSLALNFNLLPDDRIQPAIDRLHYLIKKNNHHLATGFAGTPELLHAICAPNSTSTKIPLSSISLAYKVLLGPRTPPSWLYPITVGATTIWERWDAVKPDGSVNTAHMTSLNHYAYGSVGRWIFENVGGIKMDYNANDPNVWKLVIDPTPNLEHGVSSSEMQFESPKGLVHCSWSYDTVAKHMNMRVGVPGNCEADIRILGKTVGIVGAGVWSVSGKVSETDCKILEGSEDGVRQRIPEGSPGSEISEEGWVLVDADVGR